MANGQLRLVDMIDDMCDGKDVFFRTVRHVKDIMVEDVKTLTLNDTVRTCLEFMKDNRVRHIPVMEVSEKDEEEHFIGVVSERDVFRQISPYVGKIGEEETDTKALQQTLEHIVTKEPMSVTPETQIPDMITLMLDKRIDMLPVLSDGDLVGIVTAADAALAAQHAADIIVLTPEQQIAADVDGDGLVTAADAALIAMYAAGLIDHFPVEG